MPLKTKTAKEGPSSLLRSNGFCEAGEERRGLDNGAAAAVAGVSAPAAAVAAAAVVVV